MTNEEMLKAVEDEWMAWWEETHRDDPEEEEPEG
jgi:hypothetical protein